MTVLHTSEPCCTKSCYGTQWCRCGDVAADPNEKHAILARYHQMSSGCTDCNEVSTTDSCFCNQIAVIASESVQISNQSLLAAESHCWRSPAVSLARLSQSQGARGGQTLAKFCEQVPYSAVCPTATCCTGNEGLLTVQPLPRSQERLSRQQAFAPSCAMPAACGILLSWKNWILQLTAVLFCHTPRVIKQIASYLFREQHSSQLWPVLALLF